MSLASFVTLSALEPHLGGSANMLRGPVAAADVKTCILPLLFFKRICDVWDDEYQEMAASSSRPACSRRNTAAHQGLQESHSRVQAPACSGKGC